MNRRKLHKYNVSSKERRTVDGITFDSMAEMNRYMELKMLERAGIITDLELQPKFLLIPKTEKGGRAVTISPTSNTLKTVKLFMKM